VIKLGELVMILDLHRQGLSVSAIARQVGIDRKTVRTHIAKGLEPPAYKKRPPAPSLVDGFEPYLRERLAAYPALTARRLFREMKERGFSGGYSVVRNRVRDIRPVRSIGYETRFETPPALPGDFRRWTAAASTTRVIRNRGASIRSGQRAGRSAIPPCRRLLVEPTPVRQAAEEDEGWPATTLAPSFSALEADVAAQLAPVRGIERSQLRADWHR
jgi:transposase